MPAADFSLWERGNLERFARQAADENAQLRDQVADAAGEIIALRTDLKAALAAWRTAVASQGYAQGGTLPPGTVRLVGE